jgi:VWFA-related protein
VNRGSRRLAAIAVAALLASSAVAAQDPVFTTRVDGVRVDVLVTERGRAVEGLGAADFEVRDAGIPQAIDLVSLGDVPVSVVLALDLSTSVRGAKLDALRRAGLALLDALRPEDQAALITFNTVTALRVPLTADTTPVRAALRDAQGAADTAVVDASLAAMLVGDSDAGRTLIMIFSDGVDTASFTRREAVLETARRVNGVVYGVATRSDDSRFLRDLAAVTGGRVIEVRDGEDPGPAFLEVIREFRRRYVVTFTPAGVVTGGWHPLSIRVHRPGVRVQARPGYYAAAP